MQGINYEEYRHLPPVIDGPGEYLASDGRTAVIVSLGSPGPNDQEWWAGNYKGADPEEAAYLEWTVHGVRWNRNDRARLVRRISGVRAYVRSYRR